jgi:hypothetical protein
MSTTQPTTDPDDLHPAPEADRPSRSSSRKLLGAAAFSLALAGGGVAGAVLGSPATSGAQEEGTETTDATDAEGDVRPDGPPGGRFEHRGEGLTAAAEALGLTEAELLAELQAGQSIAQVAEAQGVDLQTVEDALVANGTERLEEAIAELPDRVAEMVQREGLPGRGGFRGPGQPGGPEADDEATADDAS